MCTGGWRIGRTLGALLLLSCSGEVVGAPPEPPPELTDTPGPRRTALLTRTQYLNTLAELLPDSLQLPAPAELPDDTRVDGFATVGASTTVVSPVVVEKYEAAALSIAARMLGTCPNNADSNTPECVWWLQRRQEFMNCEGGLSELCVRTWLADFGRRAWRRLLSKHETDRLIEVYREVGSSFNDSWRGAEYVLSAILQSPYFLYRIEYGEPDPEGEHWRYTGYEIASRLAFALWNRNPDEALLAAAESGELLDDERLRQQIQRMLDDPRALWGMRQFVDDYLALDRVVASAKDSATYPQLDDSLRVSMQEEIRKLFEDTVFVEDASFLDLFDTPQTYLDKELAEFYGVPGPETGWTKGEFGPGAKRNGWLSRAATLLANAHAVKTSPTLRGLFVRQNILCQTVGSPPPNVTNMLDVPNDDVPRTLRQQLEELHAKVPACAGCHQRMDPIGFAFENFDAVGHYRDLDNGLPVDATTDLDGVAVDSAAELGVLLKEHPDTAACVVMRLFRYATGRLESESERRAIGVLSQRFAGEGYRFKALLLELFLSDAFRKVERPKEDRQ